MKNKKIILGILVVLIAGTFFILLRSGTDDERRATSDASSISYYTCGMHPSVRIPPEEYTDDTMCPICNMKLTPVYKEGAGKTEESYYGCGMEGAEHVFLIKDLKDMKCPMCGMDLIELSKEEAEKLKGVVSKVKVKGSELTRAGVVSETVKKHHLFKEIRTAGTVAYDPDLAIAQEEFISSLKAYDKMQESNIPEIKERAESLIASSKRKLKLFGLSVEQIEELEEEREVHTSLILPEEKMWIYSDVYEYEMAWVKPGEKVKVTSSNLPGEEFHGVISSVNPVLNPKTRSLRFRAEVDNTNLRLRPEMYVDVIVKSMYTSAAGEHMVLAVPKEAVLDTGTRKIIWIDTGSGEYEGRAVDVGPESVSTVDGVELKFYPVLNGLREGEVVVTRANFLIDSQSQISGVAASAYGGALETDEKAAPPAHQH